MQKRKVFLYPLSLFPYCRASTVNPFSYDSLDHCMCHKISKSTFYMPLHFANNGKSSFMICFCYCSVEFSTKSSIFMTTIRLLLYSENYLRSKQIFEQEKKTENRDKNCRANGWLKTKTDVAFVRRILNEQRTVSVAVVVCVFQIQAIRMHRALKLFFRLFTSVNITLRQRINPLLWQNILFDANEIANRE